MPTVTFAQTVLSVKRFEECVRFYRDQLGCEVVGGEPAGPFVQLGSSGQRFGLVDRRALPADLGHAGEASPAASPATLAFFTDDVDAVHERLSREGVTYAIAPRDFPEWGVRSSLCRDPDGNPVEIASPLRVTT